jgi:hypothetical protein
MESVISTEDEHAAIHPESRGALQPRNENWRRRARQARSDWIHIPLAGVVGIIDHGKGIIDHGK